MAGFLHKFNDPAWFPVFDRRNLAREEALAAKLGVPDKPMLLVKLDGSVSSPCPECPKLLPLIGERFGQDFNVINLSSVRAERIYDLLGLFDRAASLISIDTSLLHLAAASPVPFVALTNPQPWLGTLPRGNCVRRLAYSEALAEPEKVVESIQAAISQGRKEIAVAELRQPPVRRLFHCVERHTQPADKRKLAAWASWDRLYAQGVIPCHLWEYPRDATSIGDRRKLPYLKDVLKLALDQANNEDIIFFTNDDNWLHPSLPVLRFHVSLYGACSSQRCEFRGSKRLIPNMTPQGIAQMSERHIGRDLFAFTKEWLVTHWDELGDPILGASDWDFMLACLIRLQFGIVSTRNNLEQPLPPAEIERGYVAHVFHRPEWMRSGNEAKAPSQQHNRAIFRRWAATRLPDLKFDGQGRI